MGTFAWLERYNDCKVPSEKQEEFLKKVEKVFQAGGMMDIDTFKILGREIVTLHKATMAKKGMRFHYNYFEEDSWENAGVRTEDCCVFCGKIGWKHFNRAVEAAFALQQMYTDGIAVIEENNDAISAGAEIGWINYLFKEKNYIKSYDYWKIFETMHYDESEDEKRADWARFGENGYAFISNCEVYAVLNSTSEAIEKYEKDGEEFPECVALNSMKFFIQELENYITNGEESREKQLQLLLDSIRLCYEIDEIPIQWDELFDKSCVDLMKYMRASDAPAFAIKAIAEKYKKDFWDLWKEVKGIAKRNMQDIYNKSEYFMVPIPTNKFFRQNPDDMIYYWEEDGGIEFSDELHNWFIDLKNMYEIISNSEIKLEHPLEYVMDLMKYANENYFHIYAFSEFFIETMENLSDKRYLALWKLYDELLHDSELEDAGSVIFVPEGPEHEKEGIDYGLRRRLVCSFEFIEPEKRYNKARVTFRRYMALLANKPLRQKVFGF